VGRTHFLYTQYINRLHRRSGHLWQNRFYSCALDEPHLWNALCYVERNPLRARLVRAAWNYPWSSAAAHVGQGQPGAVLDMEEWGAVWTARKWREQLVRREDARELARMRLSTHRGRPLGSDGFLSKLERRLGRRLRPLAVGRPRKRDDTKAAARLSSGSAGEINR
jgi:putative transposase